MAAALAALMLAGLPWPVTAGGAGHSAVRSFSAPWVAPGGTLEVTVETANVGAGGRVEERLPASFAYLGSTLGRSRARRLGGTVIFSLRGEAGFTYAVAVPVTPGTYVFSGVVRDSDRNEESVAGESAVRVGPPPTPLPAPTATPISTATLAPTPTVPPTSAPTVAPTAATEPAPTPTPPVPSTTAPTATPEPASTPTAVPTLPPTPSPTATPTATVAPAPEPAAPPAITPPLVATPPPLSATPPPTPRPTGTREPMAPVVLPSRDGETSGSGDVPTWVMAAVLSGLAALFVAALAVVYVLARRHRERQWGRRRW